MRRLPEHRDPKVGSQARNNHLLRRAIRPLFLFSTPETFHTLFLIRTGSKENNVRLCSRAKSKGWKLHASGEEAVELFGEKAVRRAEKTGIHEKSYRTKLYRKPGRFTVHLED